jgi:H+-translocating NAD(P) transhydrogenase subunit beta
VDAQTLSIVERLGYVLAGSLFVVGLHRMNHPATARSGNQVSAAGMILAVAITVLALATGTLASSVGVVGLIIVGGVLIGGGLGLWLARSVQMTAIPQLVSLFNAVGGGAAALVAIDDFVRLSRTTGVPVDTTIFVGLGAVIGSVTFSGSLIASGKLQGIVPSRPLVIPGGRFITVLVGLVVLGGLGFLVWQASQATGATSVTYLALALVVAAALIFGITMVLPIGGADMPVVISLLNSFTGTAAAMAGFVIGNQGLIIAGALVGASGGILTRLMAQAMNRSIANIVLGGFGTGDTGGPAEAGMEGTVRQVGADDVAVMLAYAHSVIIVPGYGLAVAQAQHQVQELAELLEARGVDVKYAIHPVAGRMPGHMNVLLAEANVPYTQLYEMERVNPEFPRADVALVVGANDVTNPAARTNPKSPLYGMPILDVDEAQNVVVIKRSMRPGYAGIDNELYTNPKTGMLFGDAKEALAALTAAVKAV